MGYRICYDCAGKYAVGKRKRYNGLLAAFLVVLLVFGAAAVKLAGLEWVQEVLLPGDAAVTAAALDGFVQNIKGGETLADAITAFCQEILNGAK